jgi:hypothetical protein
MPGGAKSDIAFGFWVGVGLLILMIVLAVVQVLLGKIKA